MVDSETSKNRRRCFFDITIDGEAAGRIVMELFDEVAPKTCENFVKLCTGEAGIGKVTGKNLHYKGSTFHRVVKRFMIQGGDFSAGNGTGGESIYGGVFEDEEFVMKHNEPFVLSMANRGPDTNGSQFFITTQPAKHLNGIHVVFGKVISGQDLVKRIENLKVSEKNRPINDVVIINCGQLVRKRAISNENDIDEINEKKKARKHGKRKRSMSPNDDEQYEIKVKDKDNLEAFSTVKPEDLPIEPVGGQSRFLRRRSGTPKEQYTRGDRRRERSKSADQRRRGNVRILWSHHKVKGRGAIRYYGDDDNNRYRRNRSATPPHWKREEKRLITLKELERSKKEEAKVLEKNESKEDISTNYETFGFRTRSNNLAPLIRDAYCDLDRPISNHEKNNINYNLNKNKLEKADMDKGNEILISALDEEIEGLYEENEHKTLKENNLHKDKNSIHEKTENSSHKNSSTRHRLRSEIDNNVDTSSRAVNGINDSSKKNYDSNHNKHDSKKRDSYNKSRTKNYENSKSTKNNNESIVSTNSTMEKNINSNNENSEFVNERYGEPNAYELLYEEKLNEKKLNKAEDKAIETNNYNGKKNNNADFEQILDEQTAVCTINSSNKNENSFNADEIQQKNEVETVNCTEITQNNNNDNKKKNQTNSFESANISTTSLFSPTSSTKSDSAAKDKNVTSNLHEEDVNNVIEKEKDRSSVLTNKANSQRPSRSKSKSSSQSDHRKSRSPYKNRSRRDRSRSRRSDRRSDVRHHRSRSRYYYRNRRSRSVRRRTRSPERRRSPSFRRRRPIRRHYSPKYSISPVRRRASRSRSVRRSGRYNRSSSREYNRRSNARRSRSIDRRRRRSRSSSKRCSPNRRRSDKSRSPVRRRYSRHSRISRSPLRRKTAASSTSRSSSSTSSSSSGSSKSNSSRSMSKSSKTKVRDGSDRSNNRKRSSSEGSSDSERGSKSKSCSSSSSSDGSKSHSSNKS